MLCDNEVDRDMERFTIPALERLGELFLGKTGIFDHAPQAQNQAARIYDCRVECLPGARDPRRGGVSPPGGARVSAALPQKKNSFWSWRAGSKRRSASAVRWLRRRAPSAGPDLRKEECGHVKGRCYDGVLCCTILDHPTDAIRVVVCCDPGTAGGGRHQ